MFFFTFRRQLIMWTSAGSSSTQTQQSEQIFRLEWRWTELVAKILAVNWNIETCFAIQSWANSFRRSGWTNWTSLQNVPLLTWVFLVEDTSHLWKYLCFKRNGQADGVHFLSQELKPNYSAEKCNCASKDISILLDVSEPKYLVLTVVDCLTQLIFTWIFI